MKDIIIVRHDRCVGCGACVRSCPTPEANVSRLLDDGRIVITVNGNRCIACGECIKACPHDARDYIDDAEECMNRAAKDEKLVIIVSPEIKTALPTQWKGILDWFKKHGCYIYDVSYGADISLWAHTRVLSTGNVGNIITQHCAAAIRYAELYQPKLLKNLVPIHTPVACQAIYVKNYLRRTNPIAVLSPCIAMKSECEETGLIDYNVTFKKILEYFDRNDIRIPQNDANDLSYEYNDIQGMGTDIYPMIDGFDSALKEQIPDLEIVHREGLNIYPELDSYANVSDAKHPKVFDVYSCVSGCSLGPCLNTRQTTFDVMAMKRTISEHPDKKSRLSSYRGGYQKLFKNFDNELQLSDFTRNYRSAPPAPPLMMNQLNEAFDKLGKITDKDRSIDCGICGFRSCKEMAAAIARGQNVPESCAYMKRAGEGGGAAAGGGDPERERELEDKNRQLSEMAEECASIAAKLSESISDISEKVGSVGEKTSFSAEKTAGVKTLLGKVVKFCEDSPLMGPDEIGQLVAVLNNTINAFGPIDESIGTAVSGSEELRASVDDLTALASRLNGSLKNAEGLSE